MDYRVTASEARESIIKRDPEHGAERDVWAHRAAHERPSARVGAL
jgi:hypothetical protein